MRSGADPKTVRDQLAKLFDDGSVEVLTRQQVVDRELDRWIRGTPIGAIFMMGVAISLLVGAAIVYMVLTTDVANHLGEYATLHAMGYTQRYLSRVIMQQALLLAVVSYFPAWLLAEVLYWLTSWKAGVPVGMTMFRLGLVLVLSMLMCAASGLLALRKLQQADPAELF